MIRLASGAPEPRQCITSPALLLHTAKRHGAVVVTVNDYLSAIVYRPSGEAILWRAPVQKERAA